MNWYEFFEAAICIGLFLVAITLMARLLTGLGPFEIFM